LESFYGRLLWRFSLRGFQNADSLSRLFQQRSDTINPLIRTNPTELKWSIWKKPNGAKVCLIFIAICDSIGARQSLEFAILSKIELESLFEDIRAEQISAGDDDNEIDEERKERINQGFDKIKCVYPHINTRQKLEAATVESLLSEVQGVLGSVQPVEKATRSEFYLSISRLIDSGDRNNRKTPHYWAIIKLCRVFVTSSVLGTYSHIVCFILLLFWGGNVLMMGQNLV
jgi:hypothetical protein